MKGSKYWQGSNWPRLPHGLRPRVPPVAHAEASLEKAAQLHQARAELLTGQAERSSCRGPLFEEPLRTPCETQSQTIQVNETLPSILPLLGTVLGEYRPPLIPGCSETDR